MTYTSDELERMKNSLDISDEEFENGSYLKDLEARYNKKLKALEITYHNRLSELQRQIDEREEREIEYSEILKAKDDEIMCLKDELKNKEADMRILGRKSELRQERYDYQMNLKRENIAELEKELEKTRKELDDSKEVDEV